METNLAHGLMSDQTNIAKALVLEVNPVGAGRGALSFSGLIGAYRVATLLIHSFLVIRILRTPIPT